MTPLSRFTPSNHDPELLEELFVARYQILETVMRRVGEAAKSSQRNHTLLVGPRGAGKTHLIALAHSRTQALREEGARVQVAWLQEDLYWVTTYDELLEAIAQSLDPPLEPAIALSPRGRIELEQDLSQSASVNGPIVVFIENLDQVLDAIGELGQQGLRRFCQDAGVLLFVATTTSITRDLADQAYPFYGFFTTNDLAPFTHSDAIEMLTKIAQHRGDDQLVTYLTSTEAHARIQAIAHLAGGQPRIWSTLAAGLTTAGLRDLVDLLLTEFDNLTPYYQEQLGRLAPQQRRVINQLLTADHPLHVAEIADRLGSDRRSIAKTLAELRDRSWVIQTQSPLLQFVDKRRSYHELAEPLARLAWQIKNARAGNPIGLVVEFCKLWFDNTEQNSDRGEDLYLQAIHDVDGWEHLTLTRTLRQLPASARATTAAIGQLHDAIDALTGGDSAPALALNHALRRALEDRYDPSSPTSLTEICRELNDLASEQFGNVPHPDIGSWIQRTEQILARSDSDTDRARLAKWHAKDWNFEHATTTATSITDPESSTAAHSEIAAMLQAAGRNDEAMALYEQVLAERERLLGSDHPDTLNSRNNLAGSYWSVGRHDEALELFVRVLEERERVLGVEHPDTLTSRNNLAVSYWSVGRHDDALKLYGRVLEDMERILGVEHPDTLNSRNNLAVSYGSVGRHDEALKLDERVLEERERILGVEHPDTLNSRSNLAGSYRSVGRHDEALELFVRVLEERERVLGVEHPDTLTSRNNLAVSYWSVGRHDDALKLYERVLEEMERVLGVEHPDTLNSRSNLAGSYWSVGRHDDALKLFVRVLEERERILGVEHPDTLTSRHNLAVSYGSVGRHDEALKLDERVLEERERILGVEHPDTLHSRNNLAGSYWSVGRHDEALKLFERVLEERERVLGVEHPDTLTSRRGL